MREAVTREAIIALALLVGVLVPVVDAADSVVGSRLLTYEAPTLEARVQGQWTRGPYVSAADSTGTARDDRLDVGRLFTDVPAGAERMNLTIADTLLPFTPLRLEWFEADGGSAGGVAFCAPRYAAMPLPVPADAAFLVLWVHAASAGEELGACPLGSLAGATSGDVWLTFHAS